MSAEVGGNRNWTIDELRVLAAVFFNSRFSIGDDERDECRAMADCFGRTPASVDRQWRNMAAVVKGDDGYNVGALVKRAVADYLTNPTGSKAIAISVCRQHDWPLESLVMEGVHEPLVETAPSGLLAEIQRGLRHLVQGLEFKMFSSGSQGFYRQGKIQVGTGRYQAQVTAVLIGSKHDMTVTANAPREELAYAIMPLIETVQAKTFRTGRVGFYSSGKAAVDQERYQVSLQAVRIGEQ